MAWRAKLTHHATPQSAIFHTFSFRLPCLLFGSVTGCQRSNVTSRRRSKRQSLQYIPLRNGVSELATQPSICLMSFTVLALPTPRRHTLAASTLERRSSEPVCYELPQGGLGEKGMGRPLVLGLTPAVVKFWYRSSLSAWRSLPAAVRSGPVITGLRISRRLEDPRKSSTPA
jgi:hypothetical protein